MNNSYGYFHLGDRLRNDVRNFDINRELEAKKQFEAELPAFRELWIAAAKQGDSSYKMSLNNETYDFFFVKQLNTFCKTHGMTCYNGPSTDNQLVCYISW